MMLFEKPFDPPILNLAPSRDVTRDGQRVLMTN